MSATAIDSSYLAFFTFTFVLVVTPGSTTAVVVRNTLEGGRRAGYLTALGAALANTIIAISCGLGLSVLLSVWPGSLDAIRIGGAVFLSWLGVSSLYRAATRDDGGIQLSLDPERRAAALARGAYVGDGLGINLLSPVIISFYLSVVPAFIPAGASRFYYSGLAATHVGLAVACHAMWATALDRDAALVRRAVDPARAAGGDGRRADRARDPRDSLSDRRRMRARADHHQLPCSLRRAVNSLLGLTLAGTLAARLSVRTTPGGPLLIPRSACRHRPASRPLRSHAS